MQNIIITILALLIAFILVVFILLSKNKKTTKLDMEQLRDALYIKEIKNIKFLRKKLVIEYEDISTLDFGKAKELGAKGITIVGDTIKCYFNEDKNKNELICKEIIHEVERA